MEKSIGKNIIGVSPSNPELEKRTLEKANRELDRFVHIVSHDLSAPLRAISSFASILQRNLQGKISADDMDSLEQIVLGAHRMHELINDLLTLSRLSKIKNPYELVNLREVLDAVKDRLQVDIALSKAEIYVHEPLPKVYCDRIKLTEVFGNLIDNAIKYSKKDGIGTPRIDIGVVEQDDQYEFFVRDNGIGIEPQYSQKIFDMFQRLHSQDQYEGTGTGLYIIKTIIEEHGGKVWVQSQAGDGATFFFTIPKNLKVSTKPLN